jgi:hypothetical protein
MLFAPVLSDIATAAKPHPIVLTRMLQELYQTYCLGRSANQAIVKVDRHHPGMLRALFVKQVEAIHHVTRKPVGRAKP